MIEFVVLMLMLLLYYAWYYNGMYDYQYVRRCRFGFDVRKSFKPRLEKQRERGEAGSCVLYSAMTVAVSSRASQQTPHKKCALLRPIRL